MKRIKGSMTVEAAFVLPFFIFFMANILCLILSYERYSKTLANIHQTTKLAALACHGISMDSDTVDMSLPVSISPFVSEIGFIPSYATAHASVRKWTGYDVCSVLTTTEEEEYVYITEHGSVYHRSLSCSHLNVNIRVVSATEVDSLRNNNHAKYYPCEYCKKGYSTGLMFITPDGNRAHNNAGCSALKRQVKLVKLSEVGARGPCKDCGG